MSVKYDFSGKRVLVTGGAGGLGSAIVAKFLNSGATVFALDNNEEKLENLKKLHPKVNLLQADLKEWTETKKKVESIAPIHHLVNNAAICDLTAFEDITEELTDINFAINFKPYIHVSQAMVAGLKSYGINKGCSIVNVSSVAVDRVSSNVGLYCSTKGAISALTKVMALELGPLGIRVNEVRPTGMATDIFARDMTSKENEEIMNSALENLQNRQVHKRMLTVEEMADVILYLSTEDGEFVTGSDFKVDAGYCIT